MEHFVLFIREPGAKDLIDIHRSRVAAHSALVDHVRKWAVCIGLMLPPDDDEAVLTYFEESRAIYAIARVLPRAAMSKDQ